jgi:purine-binding chemotaxis protein CheW
MVGAETEPQADSERAESFVVFQLGGEHYALEVARVQEVLDVAQMTHVPGSSPMLRGLFNLRGHVVPVWDLRAPFGLEPAPPTGRGQCVLMVEAAGGATSRVSGLLVDRVSDVLEFLPEELQPVPTLGLGAVSSFVRGLIRHHERFLLALDLDRVFEALARESSGDVA